MKINWTTTGKHHSNNNKKRLEKLFNSVDWIEPPCTIGSMPAMAIEEAIKELKIPKVSHVAVSNELAPYSLLGIRGHYKHGEVDVFIIDEGSKLVVLASCPKFN